MQAILVINSGSSTIKFSIFSIIEKELKREYQGTVDRLLSSPIIRINSCSTSEELNENISVDGPKETYYKQVIEYILRWLETKHYSIVAAGHRIVHGGTEYPNPVILDDSIIQKLLTLTHIMPLHQPFNINGVRILQDEIPDAIQVACFDTSFHNTCNPISQHYAIPQRMHDDGIKRYGFHGLSYEYIATQLGKIMPFEEANNKFVAAHLGNGSTMCAIDQQKSVATSIGLTGIGGLPMGTRCDSLDPGAVLYIMEKYNMTIDQARNFFYRECGLLGVSGISSDMRTLLESNESEAKLAIDIFVHRISIFAGLLAAELQGFYGFIFTGGIGENAWPIRKMVCDRLGWLGIQIDDAKNQQKHKVPTMISMASSKPIWVIPTDEELMIAQHTLRLISDKLRN